MSPTGSGTLFLMRSLRFVLHLIHRLGDTAGKGCRSGSDLHLKCFSVKCKMPLPENVAGIQRILGMSQYLSKFLPRLSDITKPLRDLTRQDAEWIWDEPQQSAFECLKQAVSAMPVLRYYNLKEDVTIQCDASQRGLGVALLQGGQPVLRTLTDKEVNYAQIEKELLVIVFACEKFDAYIYGCDCVRVQTDHKPLESIFRKELCTAPKRLQRMLLRLQKYSLDVTYLKGEKMLVADTLSCAHLPEVNSCIFFSGAGRG